MNISYFAATAALVGLAMACSAGDDASQDDDGTSSSSTSQSSSPSSSATGPGGAGGSGGSGAGGGGGGAGGCPTVDLGSAVPVDYDGSTTGRPNIVESQRLEWQDAGDDALRFTAPESGTYHIALPSEPSTNGGCGVSVQEYGGALYDASWCPAPGGVATIDGVYAAGGGGLESDVDLQAGQELLLWVSCTYWSDAQDGAYTLTIDKL